MMNETESAETWDLIDEVLDKEDFRLQHEVRQQICDEFARQRGWTFRGQNESATGHFTTLSDAEAASAVFGVMFFGPKGDANGK